MKKVVPEQVSYFCDRCGNEIRNVSQQPDRIQFAHSDGEVSVFDACKPCFKFMRNESVKALPKGYQFNTSS